MKVLFSWHMLFGYEEKIQSDTLFLLIKDDIAICIAYLICNIKLFNDFRMVTTQLHVNCTREVELLKIIPVKFAIPTRVICTNQAYK